MANIINTINDMRLLEDLAQKTSVVHRIHPLAKLLTTVLFITVVTSFERYEIIRLFPFVFYPVLVFSLAELPVLPIMKRVLLVEPLLIGIGLFNPLFDQQSVVLFGGTVISAGWFTFLSILLKGTFTLTAALLLIATTGMERLARALRLLRVPRIFVLQLLLTYRYIAVLMEEVGSMLIAYALRAPRQRGVHHSAWGSLLGQLILRTFGRAERVYQAMCLRGFRGEYHTDGETKIGAHDLLYLLTWTLFFLVMRIYNLPVGLGSLFVGVIK